MLQLLKEDWRASVKAVWARSWSRIWGWSKITLGALILSWNQIIIYIGNIAIDPEVKAQIASLGLPTYVGLGLAIIGCITLVARTHRPS